MSELRDKVREQIWAKIRLYFSGAPRSCERAAIREILTIPELAHLLALAEEAEAKEGYELAVVKKVSLGSGYFRGQIRAWKACI